MGMNVHIVLSLCNLSRKELFHISVFKSDPSTVSAFTSMIHDLSKQIATAKATLFHRQLAELAKCGRLLRLFTENIDCLEDQEESLRSTITVPLHGRLDKVRCDRCQWTEALSPKHFEGPELTPCTHCRDPAREGLRQRLAGKLRPDVVYYGEDNPNAELIDSAVEEVFIECPDIVIVAGTRLETADARSITKRLCRLARDKGGVTIWVHLEKPSASCCMLPLLDYIILGDCDEFATFLSPRNGSGGHNEALDRVGLNIAREHIDSVEIAGKQGIKRKLPSLNSTHQQDIEAHELRPRLKRVRGTGKVDLPDNYSSHPAKNSDKSNADAAVFEIGRATDNTNGTMLR
jgi:NAD-dependent SIR2 family protein deacetylase